MFSAFNPSKCTHSWSIGQPTLRSPGSSWGFGALLKGLTSVVDNSCRSRDSNTQLRVTSPTLYPLEPRLPPINLLVQMVSSVYSGNQVRSTKTSVTCLQSSMVVGVSWSGAAWVLPALESYSSLREPWIPTCTVTYWSRAWSPSLRRLGRRAVLQYDNDHCLAKEAEGKCDGLAKYVSRPKPYWVSLGHHQMERGGVQGL